MVNRSSVAPLGHEFDDFLFATIGTGGIGLQTTVVSMLGRMDLDPWQAAADFAGRPAKAAAQKLASMIRAMPGEVLEPGEADASAARLIVLLPDKTADPLRRPAVPPRVAAVTDSRIRLRTLLITLFCILILCAQLLIANRSPPVPGSTPPASSSPPLR